MTTCKYKIGFLSLKSCGIAAHTQCSVCNIPVCQKHSQSLEGDTVCLECFMESRPEEVTDLPGMSSAYRRRRIYRESGYYGYYGSGYRYHDYDTFDDGQDFSADQGEEIDEADFQDS